MTIPDKQKLDSYKRFFSFSKAKNPTNIPLRSFS